MRRNLFWLSWLRLSPALRIWQFTVLARLQNSSFNLNRCCCRHSWVRLTGVPVWVSFFVAGRASKTALPCGGFHVIVPLYRCHILSPLCGCCRYCPLSPASSALSVSRAPFSSCRYLLALIISPLLEDEALGRSSLSAHRTRIPLTYMTFYACWQLACGDSSSFCSCSRYFLHSTALLERSRPWRLWN